MRTLTIAAALAALTWMGGAAAQPAAGAGPAASPPRGATAPTGRWGPRHTPGWSLMTEAERSEHRARLRSAATYEECRKVMEEQHQRMAERAKERGMAVPATPRRDACAVLKR